MESVLVAITQAETKQNALDAIDIFKLYINRNKNVHVIFNVMHMSNTYLKTLFTSKQYHLMEDHIILDDYGLNGKDKAKLWQANSRFSESKLEEKEKIA